MDKRKYKNVELQIYKNIYLVEFFITVGFAIFKGHMYDLIPPFMRDSNCHKG